jgi:hypothetical protein
MIILYTLPESQPGELIESRLRDMTAAYRRVVVKQQKNLPQYLRAYSLPFLVEGSGIYSSDQIIDTFLKKYQHTLTEWQKFQSDSCYLEDDGSTC